VLTIGVVNGLKLIQIEHDDAERTGFADEAIEDLSDAATILHAGQRIVRGLVTEGRLGLQKFILQVNNAAAGAKADIQLLLVERLDDIIVGAGVHPLNHVFLLRPGGKQKDVGVGIDPHTPHPLADLRPRHSRHHPVQNGHARRIRLLKDFPSLIAVGGRDHLIAPLLHYAFQQVAGDTTVVCDQDPHVWSVMRVHLQLPIGQIQENYPRKSTQRQERTTEIRAANRSHDS
jgi:hypothetical protein